MLSCKIKLQLNKIKILFVLKFLIGGKFMHREPTKPPIDARIFNNTARKTKKINVSPKKQRGGIRL